MAKKNNRIKVLGKRRRKSRINTGDFSGENTTIFNSRDTLSSAERDAVKKGEKRGEAEVVKANSEKYGNIGSIQPQGYGKGQAAYRGTCEKKIKRKKCEHFTGSDGMDFCSLPKDVRCKRIGL